MSKLEKIVNNPGFEKESAEMSKAIIFVFIGTFIYLLVTSATSPGFLGGFLFFVVGIFGSSVIVGVPIYFLCKSFPKISFLIDALGLMIVFFMTKFLFMLFFV